MPTLNKLEYLDATKGQIKDALNTNFNSGITEEDTFRSYVSKISDIYTNWPKVEGEGTDLSLSNTKKGLMKVDLKGNTQQDSTTGKNKFNINGTISQTSYNYYTFANETITIISATTSATLYWEDKIDVSTGTYTFMLNLINEEARPLLKFLDENDNIISNLSINGWTYNSFYGGYWKDITTKGNNIFNMTIPSTVKKAQIGFVPTKVNGEFNKMYFGSETTTYEPYTGGIASPNPDYPQDIQVVSGDNSIKVYRNYFVIDNVLDNWDSTTNKGLKNNGDGTLLISLSDHSSLTGSTPNKLSDYCPNLEVGDSVVLTANSTGSSKYIYLGLSASFWNFGDSRTLTQNDLNSQVYFYGSGHNTTTVISDIIIKKNGEEQTYPISLGNIELCKIGTYQDSIVKDNGKWYLNKQIGKVVLDGSENWHVSNTGLDNYILYCPQSAGIDGNVGYSNYYPVVAISGATTNQGICTAGGYVRVRYGEEPTIPDFKTWLSTHNVSLYNRLTTPTNTEITDTTLLSQLNNLYNANSYEGTTNVSQTNDDLGFIISASALMKGGN